MYVALLPAVRRLLMRLPRSAPALSMTRSVRTVDRLFGVNGLVDG